MRMRWRTSAEVRHAHPDGQAGAIAVAVSAAGACTLPREPALGWQLLDLAIVHTPDGLTRQGLLKACALPKGYSVELAVSALGSGSRVLSWNTVPLSLWCMAQRLDDYQEAMLGDGLWPGEDRDTTCAMAGGIVALVTGRDGLPRQAS